MARTDPRPNYGEKRRARKDGYIDVWCPGHPTVRADGYSMEHRVIAWDAGLLTDLNDVVHHRNHDRSDNRLKNLAVKARATHALDHVEERGWVTNQHGTFPIKSRSQRRTAPKPERVCVLCGADIPATMRRDARFCSSGCRVTSFKRQRREQTGQAPQP